MKARVRASAKRERGMDPPARMRARTGVVLDDGEPDFLGTALQRCGTVSRKWGLTSLMSAILSGIERDLQRLVGADRDIRTHSRPFQPPIPDRVVVSDGYAQMEAAR